MEIKRFIDYRPTAKEIDSMFSSVDNYKYVVDMFARSSSCDDYEKLKIACLLFMRGLRDESWSVIESMEDEEYKKYEGEQSYASWVAWEKGLKL